MIGIDYDYGRTKRATLLTWRRNGNKLKACVHVSILPSPINYY